MDEMELLEPDVEAVRVCQPYPCTIVHNDSVGRIDAVAGGRSITLNWL